MSLTLWRRVRNNPRLNVSALIRSKADWLTIFRAQTDGSPEEIAARIFGDLACYSATRNVRGQELPRDGFFSDVPQLANALRAFFEFPPIRSGDLRLKVYRVDSDNIFGSEYFEDQDSAVTRFIAASRTCRNVVMLKCIHGSWKVLLKKGEKEAGPREYAQ